MAREERKKKPAAKAKERPEQKPSELLDLDPDRLPVTERRAQYLSDLAGIETKKITGKSIGEVHELLRWRLDPQLTVFRRVCGQVVKRDPVTNALLPVPNATVHVEDTDCNFFGYFPSSSPYAWLYPFGCRREEIATVRTDSCGRFCVFLPLWDIDRILRWRRERICKWEFFRPRIRDLLARQPELGRPPLPDPGPLTRIAPEALERVRDLAGDPVARRLEAARELSLHGDRHAGLDELLDEPLFPSATPPPLPEELRDEKRQRELDLATEVGLRGEKIDFRRFVGPFFRCHDVFLPTWQTVFDVPDITFRVTQDYDDDGVEEVIYSEGLFDVRWNTTSIPDVTLEASGNAVAAPHCGPVKEIPCGNVPSIEAAGYLDLEPDYHDDADGYCLRVNRPSPDGSYPPPPFEGVASSVTATAPYARNLNLHGCVRLEKATHYRIKFEYRPQADDPWGAQTPFLGIFWAAPRQGPGAPILFAPDGDGWYPIVDPAILVHPNWLLPWNTAARPDGFYRLQLELGRLTGGSIDPGSTSAARVFRVDNSRPSAAFVEVRWRVAKHPGSWADPWNDGNSTQVLPAPEGTCPVIQRPTGKDIELSVTWTASARHLRDARLVQSGCGGGDLQRVQAEEEYQHWHTGPLDNNVSRTNFYRLPSDHPPGCYTLGIRAWTRAFNPQDFDAASTKDWWINQGPLEASPSRAISVVNV